ncbi:MAG TPA: gluconate 2-dehydrogenase subunit 3 family protein [Novosphingobium sp.]|nr:gluconate 2-dehydrogenase subunit 3 family protein [Novosphingobium sp.]
MSRILSAGEANRRDFLSGAALLALALGLPAGALAATPAIPAASPRQHQMLAAASQIAIPRTDTPGAADAGVPDFVVLALDHGLEDARRPVTNAPKGMPLRADGSIDHLRWLELALDTAAGGDFLALAAPRQAEALARIDTAAFAAPRDAPPSPWLTIKALIYIGYYTSEAGGSQELRYELVPGQFEPDAPLHPGDRAFSSDWTAIDFG